jgi:hypothetical protein
MISRTEADGIAIERQSAIFEIAQSVTDRWADHSDLDKANYLAAAIVELHCQVARAEDLDLERAIEWEISELSKAHEFFRVACGRSPVVGQLALEVTA